MKKPTLYSTILCVFAFIFPTLSAQVSPQTRQLINEYLASHNDSLKRQSTSFEYEVIQDRIDPSSGIRSIQALQKVNGIYVLEGILSLNYGLYGHLHAVDQFVDPFPVNRASRISAEEAVSTALSYHNMPSPAYLHVKEPPSGMDHHTIFTRNEATASDIIARLMYINNKNADGLILTWEIQTHTADRQNYWVTYVDAISGRVLTSEDKVLHCSFGGGLVYDASPAEQLQIDAQHHAMHMRSARDWDEVIAQRTESFATENTNAEDIETEFNDPRASNKTEATLPPVVVAPVNTYLVLNIPAEAPNDTTAINTQTTVATAGDPIASPWGWTSNDNIDQNKYTKGNNVWAFHDPSPGPLGGAPNPVTGALSTGFDIVTMQQEFIYPWDLTQEPEYFSTTDPSNLFPNRNAAITNLFYWNNLIHDIFYHFGFTESGRNFQFDNMGNGGMGADEVLAQAQDGGGTNNANFLTLADGVNGQMQMYLWTTSVPDSLVKISSVSISTTVNAGDAFASIQGALYNSATPIDLYTNPVLNKNFVLVNDGCGSPEGCGAGSGVGLPPCNTVSDAIVLIDRGTCSFVEKVHGAQLGGAAGVIVINNNTANPNEILAMGGSDATTNTITIPAVMISYNSGVKLKTALAAGAVIVGSLQRDNPPLPKKDGDFDNGIIAHEYGHGISNRLSPQTATGGSLSGSEQGGEGWSDYIALYLVTTESDLSSPATGHPNGVLPNRGIGTYVQYTGYNGAGIRPRLYSMDENVNEYTYSGETNGGKGVGNAPEITIPHGVGFIWCTMLWEMTQNLIDLYGFNDDKYYNPPSTGNYSADSAVIAANNAGNNLALKLILQGIALQPSGPTFAQMREGILQADMLLYNGAHQCLIWEAFAKRGLGLNAVSGTNAIGDETDGYATPCNTTQVFYDIKKSGVTLMSNKNTISYTITVSNTSPFDNTGYDIEVLDVMPDEMIFLDASGAAYTQSNDSIFFEIDSIEQGQSVILTVNAFVNTPASSQPVVFYDFESGAQGWLVITGGFNEFIYTTDAPNAHSGSSFFYTTNLGLTGANTMLVSPVLDTSITNRQLRFWHKFGTDAGYDGGFVETTLDGIEWTRLPLQVNGYNGALNSTFNPANAGAAFTGLIPGYIESAGALPDGVTQVRFVFSEDVGMGGGDGWWIDDVRIVQNPVTVTNRVYVDDPIASGGRTHSSEATTLIMPEEPDNACAIVSITSDEGVGSLPFAIGCADAGDTIRFANSLHQDTILLVNHKAIVGKDLVFSAMPLDSIFISGANVDHTFEINLNTSVELAGLHIIAGTGSSGAALFNEGNIELRNISIYERASGNTGTLVHNANGANLMVSELTTIYIE